MLRLTRGALLAVGLLLVAAACRVAVDERVGGTLAFPRSAVTTQDKIDWLTAEAESTAQAVDAETERPLSQQREALYRAALTRGAGLMRLLNTLAGRFPRLEARVYETRTNALGGLERIANGRLKIGMSTEEVRQIRGEPSRISEMTTTGRARQRWQYGQTVLVFDDGKLVEIRQMLNGD